MTDPLRWFRMYSDAVDNPKLRLCSFDDRWHFFALCCCKAQGVFEEEDEELRKKILSVKLGLDSVELETVVKRLRNVKLVSCNGEPLKWNERQFVSDTSTNRVRAFRKRFRNGSETPSETDTESESESESDKNAAAFAQIRALYPERSGRADWDRAEHYCNVIVERGTLWSELAEAVERYAAYCAATQSTGTQHVLMPGNFFGSPDKPWSQPWNLPKTKADMRLASNLSAAEEFMRRTENT